MPMRQGPPAERPAPPGGWTFLTNHAHVLFVLAQDPLARHRDVAAQVGITERAVVRIVGELVAAGYVSVTREGRRNHYAVHGDRPLRHPIERHRRAQDLVDLVLHGAAGTAAGAAPSRARGERAAVRQPSPPAPRPAARRAR